MAKKDSKKVRYAVVGAGNIAQVAVLPAFRHAKENSELVALISGDAEKRRALGERYSIDTLGGYEDFESVLDKARVGAVYVCTPNTEHREFVVRAAERGVHVLCEKPLATSVQDCELMRAACEQSGVRLMVAYRLHFEAANLKAIDIARSGKLGTPRLFSSFFSHVVRAGDIRRDPEVGGGASYDLGVYCINAVRHLFGAEPIEGATSVRGVGTAVATYSAWQHARKARVGATARRQATRLAARCTKPSGARSAPVDRARR